MAGRKHHHIPQQLLRGFATGADKRHAQVWVFRADRPPFVRSTENYGAQRDFYGDPVDTRVDDLITDAENGRFNGFIDELRKAGNGATIESRDAARFYQHLLYRTKNIRSVFTEITSRMVSATVGELLQKEKLVPFLTELCARHSHQLLGKAETQLGRAFTPAERLAVRIFLEKNLSSLVPEFVEQQWPALEASIGGLVARIPEIVEAGHQKALLENFSNDGGKREEEMRQLHWRVYDVQERIVLGDSCSFALLKSGKFKPFTDASDESSTLYLPVSTFRFLAGEHPGQNPLLSPSELVRGAVECSYESFCAAEKAGSLELMVKNLGRSAMPVSHEELRQIATDGLGDLLVERLVKGFSDL